VLEVVPYVLTLEQEAQAVEGQLRRLSDATAVDPEVEDADARISELQQRLASLPALGAASGDEILYLRHQVEAATAKLDPLLATVAERAANVDQLEARWRERLEFLTGWQKSLAGDPAFPSVEGRLQSGRRKVSEVLSGLSRAIPATVERQQHVRDLLLAGHELELAVRREYLGWRRSFRQRSAPALLSGAFWRSLSGAAAAIEAPVPAPLPANPEQALLALGCALGGLLLALGLRRFQSWARVEPGAQPLLAHPWRVGLFAAVVAFATLRRPLGGWFEVGVALAVAVALCLLVSSAQAGWPRRLAVYLLSLALVAQAAAEALVLPASLYRLGLLAFSLAGLPLLGFLARQDHRRWGRRTPFVTSAAVGLAGLAVLAVAELASFHSLARWLAKALLGTLALFLVAHFTLELGGSALRLALDSPPARRSKFLGRVRVELERRGLWALKAVVGVVGALTLLDFWDVVDSPQEAWGRLVGLSITLGDLKLQVGQVLLSFGAVLLAFSLSRLLRIVLDEEGHRAELDRGARDSVKTLVHYTLMTLGFLVGLSLLGIDLRNLTILAGAFGVGIGFGLQTIVNNFVSGMILLFERPIRHGDLVSLGGDTGVVQRIGLRSTTILTYDRSEVIVPNNQLVAEKVINWTLSSRTARLVLPIGVAYGSDLAHVQRVLCEVAAELPQVLAEPAPFAGPVAFGDSAIQLELRVWLNDAEARPRVLATLIERIAVRLAAEKIAIPFPQLDVYLHPQEGS
nr:mechanosensitive ion channel [Thermoanaerobaculia bacterium]